MRIKIKNIVESNIYLYIEGRDKTVFEMQKQELCEYGIKVLESGLVRGTGGNLSARVGKLGEYYIITPSGMDYKLISPKDIPVIAINDGKIIEGDKKPSIEHIMHREIYLKRSDVKAIIHTHSFYGKVLSIIEKQLPNIDLSVVLMGGPIKVAPYVRHGTKELAEAVVQALGNRKAALMANHGQISVGTSLKDAFNTSLSLEECAHMYLVARSIVAPDSISVINESPEELYAYFKKVYGQK